CDLRHLMQLRMATSSFSHPLHDALPISGGQGIYDRASFTGLGLPLAVSLRGDQLQLDTEALRISSLDPGLPLGPLQASVRYRTTDRQRTRLNTGHAKNSHAGFRLNKNTG